MTRRAFFFPHAVEPNLGKGGPSGRVPFDVTADLVSGTETTRDAARICAEGYKPNVVGSSQDPCVFDGPFHAFSRIDSMRADNAVKGTKHPLSYVVKPGDVIIYGKFEPRGEGPTTMIWVDTVLVVDSFVRWTTSTRAPGSKCKNPACTHPKALVLTSPANMAKTLTGAADGAATAAYKYTLHDAESEGLHCCTALGDYRVIKGKRVATPEAVKNLETSFVTLADVHGEETFPAYVGEAELGESFAKLQAFLDTEVRRTTKGPKGGSIVEFPEFDLAEKLLAAVVASSGRSQNRAGTVAIPPLEPAAPIHRWSSLTRSVSETPV